MISFYSPLKLDSLVLAFENAIRVECAVHGVEFVDLVLRIAFRSPGIGRSITVSVYLSGTLVYVEA